MAYILKEYIYFVVPTKCSAQASPSTTGNTPRITVLCFQMKSELVLVAMKIMVTASKSQTVTVKYGGGSGAFVRIDLPEG